MNTDLKCNVTLFADDTSLFSVAHIPNECAAILNHDLDLIKPWAHDWRMSFNPDPPKPRSGSIIFQNKIPIDHPPISLNDIPVVKVDIHNHIGMVIDSRLKSSSHTYGGQSLSLHCFA